jgi:hypothetical protein
MNKVNLEATAALGGIGGGGDLTTNVVDMGSYERHDDGTLSKVKYDISIPADDDSRPVYEVIYCNFVAPLVPNGTGRLRLVIYPTGDRVRNAETQRGAWCVHSRHRPGCADAPDDAGARRQRDARCPIPTGWKIPARHTCCRVPRPSFSHALCAASKKFCISGSARALEVSARPERYDDSRPTPPMRIVPLVGSPLGASARGAAHIAHRRAPLAPGGASAFGALRSCTVGRSVANDPDRKWLISSGLRPIRFTFVRTKLQRHVSSRRPLCGSHSPWCKACRPAGATASQIRNGVEHQDSQGARPCRAAIDFAARRRGDRMKRRHD